MIKLKKNGSKAWVTFTVKGDKDLKNVQIAGSWSNWKKENLKQKKNGDFYITKILPAGQIYEFRYILNSKEWANDEDAISVTNSFGSVNSAIEV